MVTHTEHVKLPKHADLPPHSCAPFTPDEHARAMRLTDLIDLIDLLADDYLLAGNLTRMDELNDRILPVIAAVQEMWDTARNRPTDSVN